VRVVPRVPNGVLRDGLAMAGSLLTRAPFLLSRHRSAALQREMSRALSKADKGRRAVDAVHFNHLDTALYCAVVPAEVPCVLDEHNVVANQVRTTAKSESNIARRALLAREYRTLRRVEPAICNRMSRCFVCSDADATHLRGFGVTRPIAVIPNGVDLNQFAPCELRKEYGAGVVFVGTLDYEPCERGVWLFCREILPLVHAEIPQLRFTVVGRNPSPRLRALARADSRIELTGRVDDVRPYVCRAQAAVVPLQSGSGTRLKILEAFALGVPVISTTIGAEGIEAVDGLHLLLADDPQTFARSVLNLMRDRALAERLRAGARRLVIEKYGWEGICERLLTEYRELSDRIHGPA